MLAFLLGNLWEPRECNASEAVDHWPESLQAAEISVAWGGRNAKFGGTLEIKKCWKRWMAKSANQTSPCEGITNAWLCRKKINVSRALLWKRRHFSPIYGNHRTTMNLWWMLSPRECMFTNPCGPWTTEINWHPVADATKTVSVTHPLSLSCRWVSVKVFSNPKDRVLGRHVDWNSCPKDWRLACFNSLWV